MKLSPLVSFFLPFLAKRRTDRAEANTYIRLSRSVAESPKQATERSPTSQAQTRFAPAQVQGRWSVHVRKREGLDGWMYSTEYTSPLQTSCLTSPRQSPYLPLPSSPRYRYRPAAHPHNTHGDTADTNELSPVLSSSYRAV